MIALFIDLSFLLASVIYSISTVEFHHVGTIVDIILYMAFCRIVFNIIRLLSISIYAISLTSCLMYHRLNQYLALQARKCKFKCHESIKLALKLSVFRREHHRNTRILIFCNQNLFSAISYSSFLTNVPFNACMLTLIVLNEVPMSNKFYMVASYLTQTLFSALILVKIANCNELIYASNKHMPILQTGMGKYQLRDKIHHLRYYELVHYKQDMGMSAGPLGVFSKRKLSEVCSIKNPIDFHLINLFYF